jgi:hypothetical protein
VPLALHLAGAYLASRFARWDTFDDYRRALDSAELRVAMGDMDDHAGHARAAIKRTWDLFNGRRSTGAQRAAPSLPERRRIIGEIDSPALRQLPSTEVYVPAVMPSVLWRSMADTTFISTPAARASVAARYLRSCSRIGGR